MIIHALVDHYLDTTFRYFMRLDKRLILRNSYGGLGLHFCCPVGECEGLVGWEGADVNFDYTALEDIVSELLEHLSLGSVNDVAEVHVLFEVALEGYLNGLWDWHVGFTCGECEGNGTGVSSKSHAL